MKQNFKTTERVAAEKTWRWPENVFGERRRRWNLSNHSRFAFHQVQFGVRRTKKMTWNFQFFICLF